MARIPLHTLQVLKIAYIGQFVEVQEQDIVILLEI